MNEPATYACPRCGTRVLWDNVRNPPHVCESVRRERYLLVVADTQTQGAARHMGALVASFTDADGRPVEDV